MQLGTIEREGVSCGKNISPKIPWNEHPFVILFNWRVVPAHHSQEGAEGQPEWALDPRSAPLAQIPRKPHAGSIC